MKPRSRSTTELPGDRGRVIGDLEQSRRANAGSGSDARAEEHGRTARRDDAEAGGRHGLDDQGVTGTPRPRTRASPSGRMISRPA